MSFLQTKEPIVSVVIACRNGEKYVREALNSALNQNVSLEIVFVDDFSDDNTPEILADYISKYDNIIYVRNDSNIGVAMSRNKGVSIAKGKYIAFLDADDIWCDDKISRQIQLMERLNCDFSYTARELIEDNGDETGRIVPVFEKITYNELLKTNSIPCSSVVLLRNIAVEFPMQKGNLHEDYLNWLKILRKCKVAYGINEPLFKYRLSPAGKSRNKLKSAVMTYSVHRKNGSNMLKALLYTYSHLTYGVKKYLKSYFGR